MGEAGFVHVSGGSQYGHVPGDHHVGRQDIHGDEDTVAWDDRDRAVDREEYILAVDSVLAQGRIGQRDRWREGC